MSSGIEARVKEWDTDTKILKISNVGIGTTTTFGEKFKQLNQHSLLLVQQLRLQLE